MQRSENMESYFSYELTAVPTSLFKDHSLRKSDESILANEVMKDIDKSVQIRESKIYIVDGMWLLHRVKWQQENVSYEDIS